MTGVFGIVHRDGDSPDPAELKRLSDAISAGGGGAVPLPSPGPALRARECASGRLDNRAQLARDLGLGTNDSARSDADMILAAYSQWGEDAPARLLGDWCLAAWDPRARRLFLARDQYGNGAVHYFADARMVAFAPSAHALLALGAVSSELDELYLAQYLISWPAYQGMRTSLRSVRRLPPAHSLTVGRDRIENRCYRDIELVPELRLSRREEYAEGLRAVFDEAVRVRLPAGGAVGVTLSGGLDSGAVAATAASLLAEQGRRLQAFTAVPVSDSRSYVGGRFGDELPFARAVAEAAGNVDLHVLDSRGLTPVSGIRQALSVIGAPIHAAANQFWLMDLQRAAAEQECSILLTGQMGNAGLSWTGSPLSQPWRYQLQTLGPAGMLRQHVLRALPHSARAFRARRRPRDGDRSFPASAIHPAFARRLQLAERRLEDPGLFALPGVPERLRTLKPGRLVVGDIYSSVGAASGVAGSDPTADVRVIQFALSVPDRVFIDPATGTDRWLIREAMRGRLPDAVRLNPGRGRQAADLVPRLRASAAEVETALDELAVGPAAAYVDVPYMREAWTMIQRRDTADAFNRAVTVLTRGIMGGLFVRALARGELRPVALPRSRARP